MHAFKIAVRGTLKIGPYDQPWETSFVKSEWLIAERIGQAGRYISLAHTGVAAEADDTIAPATLRPTQKLFGIQIDATKSTAEATFLFMRRQGAGFIGEDQFFPAEGYLNLCGSADKLVLVAAGRHHHTVGSNDSGARVLIDVPYPAPRSSQGQSWHYSASRVPWLEEYF